MAKSKDYIYDDVIDISGHKLGYVKDLIVDMGNKRVLGFKVNSPKLLKKEFNILKENVIYSKAQLVVSGITQGENLLFSSFLNMHVIDKNSNVIGLVSELLFDKDTFEIKGVFVKGYSIFTMFKKRRIILIRDLIIGEKYILYTGGCEDILMECIPSIEKHSFNRRDLYYEKD